MTYEPIKYPCWRYSATGKKLCQTPAEEEALGPGWYDTPAKIGSEPVAVKPDLAELTKSELEALAEEAGLEVEGTGRGGSVRKKDLIAALEG